MSCWQTVVYRIDLSQYPDIQNQRDLPMKHLTSIYRYPIKSSMPVSLQESVVDKRGLEFDRLWCIFDKNHQALTAREYPQILDIEASVSEQELLVRYRNKSIGNIPLQIPSTDPKAVKIFDYDSQAVTTSDSLNIWISDLLGTDCQILFQHQSFKRQVLEKHGGATGDVVGFADQCPILLTTEASLADLNSRMKQPIGMNRFRPNLVIKGSAAWDEDHWQLIKIGNCEFKVNQPCIRCVLTTIDPVTKLKDPDTEPLRTMGTFRKGPAGGVVFGMHITAVNGGMVKLDDTVEILK